MKGRLKDKSAHFKWLNAARLDSQNALLQLYAFGVNNRRAIKSKGHPRQAFGLLVGAAFSLWRAAFLCDTRRTTAREAEGALVLLDKVIEENIVGFPTERTSKEWMGGYYLNNALFRLGVVLDRHLHPIPTGPAIDAFQRLQKTEMSGARPMVAWRVLNDALVSMIEALERR